jgi:hypothetical protein
MRCRILRVTFSMAIVLLAARSEAGDFVSGPKLIGAPSVGANPAQGSAVALSSDGATAIIGAQNEPPSGAAWVFRRSGRSWKHVAAKLTGTGSAGFSRLGSSVALSDDGNTALVGGQGDNDNVGAAWVFTWNGLVWAQQGNKIVAQGTTGLANVGYSDAISADGNTAIVGGPGDNGNVGAAWIFTRNVDTWSQQGLKLTGAGAVGTPNFGTSVALSADGNTAIVGGPFDDDAVGAAWVFTRSANVWTAQGSKLVGTPVDGPALRGKSVALSSDANTALVAGPFNEGAVWVFTRSGSTWTQLGSKLVGADAVSVPNFGVSVSLSGEGNTAAIGGPNDESGTGAVWFFERNGSSWTQRSRIIGTGVRGSSGQGTSVALSRNASTAIVGGPADDQNFGAAWIHTAVNPGDANGDGTVGVLDVFYLINFLFAGGPAPQ